MALTFYYGSGSPYAWKVWLVLEHKNIPYEFRLLSFDKGETKAPSFLAVNPRGQVPTIVDDGFALWESAVIAEYLEDRYPQKPLLPSDAKARATARRVAAEAQDYLTKAVGGLAEITLFRKDPATPAEIAAAQAAVLAELSRIEAQMAGPYLVGQLSLADFTVFPSVRLLRRIDDRQPGKGIANDRLPPKLKAWVTQIESLPYYEKTIPPHWKG
jgi:glutathione S-transferase